MCKFDEWFNIMRFKTGQVKLPTKQKAEVASASGDRNLRKKTPFIDPGSRGGSLVYSKDSDDEPFRPAAD